MAKREALWQLIQMGLIGAGGGVAGRSLLGLGQLFQSPAQPISLATSPAMRPEITGPSLDDEQEKLAGTPAAPAAPPATPPPAAPKSDWFQRLANALPHITTQSPLGDWWGPSASLGAAGAGLVGGYSLTDWLARRDAEANRKDELQQAEDEYRKSLTDEYRAAMLAKQAGDDLGIDSLFDALAGIEKKADGLFDMLQTPYSNVAGHDNWQWAKGGLIAAMLATGLGTGYAAYNTARDSQSQQLLRKAISARARRRALLSPQPLLAITAKPPKAEDEETYANQYSG